ncbi:phosphotransferase family protein [Granulosicoccus antarcticus]|uniref:Aminoglycoside phosphotransferase domain-containing protein n=1 Tax=Granulosicoccus antarcticus IMCC3135 TaxID=1192854 RepID=A0A2Z2NPE1_9GAMM|nr:hypothetical protein [Granulosicoccus antarcticus]ASJ73129.1 hypothetical protein IMCC3135_15225 [Granulosicoccus antarcticus IMCC3135]
MAKTKTKKRSSSKSRNRSDSAAYRKIALTKATEALLETQVVGVEYPGGKSRESYRMLLANGSSVIATRRSSLQLARREVCTLGALNLHDAPVPQLLGTNHSQILIQEELVGQRLSEALKEADAKRYGELIDAALSSLVAIQQAASAELLENQVEALGDEDSWIQGLLHRPEVIGEYLGAPAPELDKAALIALLRIRQPRFIKWDARPGNALVTQGGVVKWFDWEHAGKRNRLDDMAWMLGDEYLPDHPEAERLLIDKFVPLFSDGADATEAYHYLMAYGSFHMVVRVGLILKYMTDGWWDIDKCIEEDKVGVSLICATRLCQRGARWSAECELTAPLSAWFVAAQSKINEL